MTKPLLIDQPTLSLAWAEAFLAVRATSGHRLAPLTVSFQGFDGPVIAEDLAIRSALDAVMADTGMQKVQTVANTIFPLALWRRAKGNRQAFYAAYRENLPEYVAMAPYKNRRGLYFGRLIAYDLDHKTGDRLPHIPAGAIPEDGNQLEFIIQRCKKGVRVSAFQASTFDPARDHTAAAQLGFPCLQHLTFVPSFSEGTLLLNAFYATQQLFEKGYGNYLGLARLGLFVAQQVGLSLARVTCFVGVEKMESRPRRGPLLDAVIGACEAGLAAERTRVGAQV
ncbi:MAG: thymidylate synthase [Acidobacteria bacterium]|nr:thymidylate synthase [Acidobacteriota bacterium]